MKYVRHIGRLEFIRALTIFHIASQNRIKQTNKQVNETVENVKGVRKVTREQDGVSMTTYE